MMRGGLQAQPMHGDGIVATALAARFAFGFQYRLRHFLDEQWNAIGALIMFCLVLCSSALLPVTRSMIAAISRSPRRLRLSAVT